MGRLRLRLLPVGAAWALVAACAAPVQAPPKMPTSDHIEDFTDYAFTAMRLGDDQSARQALENAAKLGGGRLPPPDSALFLRDLAEIRLATGDNAGAQQAAQQASERLQLIPLTSQFTTEDQTLDQRLLDSLAAAGAGDQPQLQANCQSSARPSAADPCFLLGWVLEHAGDASGSRAAYARYLDLSPRFDYLRRSGSMRAHASQVTGQWPAP